MTNTGWEFSPLEFTVLWRGFGRDVLPYPLRYRSTENSYEEYEQAWKSAAAAVHDRYDESLYSCLRVLARPEARIEVSGFAGGSPVAPAGPRPAEHMLRVHAAVSLQHAIVLIQQATDDLDRGGTVWMGRVRASDICAWITDRLPPTPRGTGPGVRISRHDLEDEGGPFTAFTDDAAVPPRKTAQRFFERPRSTVAHLGVYPGGAYDNRPAPSRGVHILDYPDGRYTARFAGNELRAEPADSGSITALVGKQLDTTLRDYRDEFEPGYA